MLDDTYTPLYLCYAILFFHVFEIFYNKYMKIIQSESLIQQARQVDESNKSYRTSSIEHCS